jgi:hypothetical protein
VCRPPSFSLQQRLSDAADVECPEINLGPLNYWKSSCFQDVGRCFPDNPDRDGGTGVGADACAQSGCPAAVTFHKDVLPVLQKNCQHCANLQITADSAQPLSTGWPAER